MSMTSKVFPLLLGFFVLGVAFGQAEPQNESSARNLNQIEDQLDQVQAMAVVASLLAAEQHLAAAEFHAIDEALNAGESNPRYLNTVRNSIIVTNAVAWPEELRPEADAFLEAAKDLATALEAEDAEDAGQAASRTHDAQHLLSSEIFAYLAGTETESTDEATEGVPQGAVLLELQLNEQGGAVGGATTFRVRRGDAVALAVTSETSGNLHLHGYDEEMELRAGERSVVSFTANATGRYPVEVHPVGADDGVVVGYLEVRP